MKQRVYIETTIVSYLTAWAAKDVLERARQKATTLWWRTHRPQCDVFVSGLVEIEAGRGDASAALRRMNAMAGFLRLPMTDEATMLAKMLMRAHALPTSAEDDALHVGLAAVHGMDILLTWNCRHIANVIAMPKIRATIEQSGYNAPTITTPADLLESLGEVP